jgi:hypothetical protein
MPARQRYTSLPGGLSYLFLYEDAALRFLSKILLKQILDVADPDSCWACGSVCGPGNIASDPDPDSVRSLDPDPDSESGSRSRTRKAEMTHKSRKKLRKLTKSYWPKTLAN